MKLGEHGEVSPDELSIVVQFLAKAAPANDDVLKSTLALFELVEEELTEVGRLGIEASNLLALETHC